MKIETLKERIAKTKENIKKTTATLERHNAQLVKKTKVLTDKGIDPKNCDRFNHCQTQTYWDICDYEGKKEDIENTEKKIDDYKKTLAGLEKQLKDQLAKDKETESMIPEVLNQFLEQWKQKCVKFYEALATDYIKIATKDSEEFVITKEELEKLKEREYNSKTRKYEMVNCYTAEQIEAILSGNVRGYEERSIKSKIKARYIKDFVSSHFASDMAVVYRITEYSKVSKATLNRILDDDVKVKKNMFVSRIKEVIGEVKDLKGLKISAKGEINGIAKGVKCNAKVETITAGGYNIQCFHFRVLVNTVK